MVQSNIEIVAWQIWNSHLPVASQPQAMVTNNRLKRKKRWGKHYDRCYTPDWARAEHPACECFACTYFAEIATLER